MSGRTGGLRLVVLGMMGYAPFAGQTWLYLNWILGLRALGHEVWYVEDNALWPYDPRSRTFASDCSYGVDHVRSCLARIGVEREWAYRPSPDSDRCFNLTVTELADLYRSADALLNIVGVTELRDEHCEATARVYVETDPVVAELRIANGDEKTARLFARHTAFATYGENYGAVDCGVPTNGVTFAKTRQPIDLDWWRPAGDGEGRHVTTIANYRHPPEYDVEYQGETYRWSKHLEWAKFMDLPRRTEQTFEVALKVDDERDREELTRHGWRLVDPLPMSLDPFGAYRAFIAGSRAEFSVAKDQNVRLRSGWFSERDACYLACGRPVVAQDTGFGAALPTGRGLFAVASVDEAASAIDEIDAEYPRHAAAARELAVDHFGAAGVAGRLLHDVGLS
jgi:hypothetical protein